MNNPRILQIGKFYPPDIGGMEFFLYDLTEELSKHVKIDVLCSHSKPQSQIENKSRYTIYRTASFGKLASTSISPQMVFWLKKLSGSYDLIHLHLPNPTANMAFFLVRPKAKLVLHWHSDIIKQKKLLKIYEPFQAWLLKRADKIIATSPNYIAGSKYLMAYSKKCVPIPLGINPKRLFETDTKVKEIRNLYHDKPIVLSVGRLIYYKGYKYLVEAMKNIDAYLLIAGEGPLKSNLSMQIQNMHLQKKVVLLGKIDDIYLGSFYKACDIFCLPSIERSEAFGLVQIEAMFFGKPIISTDIANSGVSWVNQNNVTGFVVKTKNVDALSDAINHLLREKNLSVKFGNNGRERFQRNFQIDIIAKNFLELYASLVKENANHFDLIKHKKGKMQMMHSQEFEKIPF